LTTAATLWWSTRGGSKLNPQPGFMNILFLIHHPELHGSNRSLLDLVEGLRAFEVSPFFVLPAQGSLSALLEQMQFPFAVLPVPYWLSNKKLTLAQKLSLRKEIRQSSEQLLGLIRERGIDLVYTNTSASPAGALAARKAGIPHVWHLREGFWPDFHLKPILTHKHVSKFILRAGEVICNSRDVLRSHFGTSGRSAHVVYNGVGTQAQFEQRLRASRSTPRPDVFTLILPSVLTPQKGQEHAIRALAALRTQGIPARLVLAGGGKPDYLEYLKSLAAGLGVQDLVSFVGFTADPFPLYYQADCALVCSDYEALSRVALEAMSCALPVIGKNSGGTPEIIVNGETGYLYNTPEELAGRMGELARDRSLSRRMGQAGWERAREQFSIEKCAASVYQVIQSVMSKA